VVQEWLKFLECTLTLFFNFIFIQLDVYPWGWNIAHYNCIVLGNVLGWLKNCLINKIYWKKIKENIYKIYGIVSPI